MTTAATGCVTVHGETKLRPAATKTEAARVLEEFTNDNNKANRTLDRGLNREIETGPLGAIDQAGLKARKKQNPNGNPDYTPLELTDPKYLIPKQAGWPRWFVADARANRPSADTKNRWLVLFEKKAEGKPWKAAYLSVMQPGELPDLARDKDGYVKPVEPGPEERLSTPVPDLDTSYVNYLKSGGKNPGFAPGQHTTQWVEERKKQAKQPGYVTQFRDTPAAGFATYALRTRDGGALAFFSTRHFAKQTVAPGRTIRLDGVVKALLTGEAKRSVTLEWVSEQAVLVPKKGKKGDVEFLNRIQGLVGAKGE
nr:hypothetical protein [Streptomyces coryli]